MKLFRNAVKLGLIGGILALLIVVNPPKSSASSSVFLDTATGNDLVELVYPHYQFTPIATGTLESIDVIFSTKNTSVDFLATIENDLSQPIDCVSDTILGTSGNPLAENSVITHVAGFHGAQCGLVSGNLYGINFGSLIAFGGVWGDSSHIGGYGIYYGTFNGTCSDGVKNQNETGVDVGGVCGGGGLTHNPVLIVPGVLGTDIIKGGDKLWLDLGRNFLDIGDQFMDPLQFDGSLKPLDTSLVMGEVLRKEGFQAFNFDYTSGLIQEFKNKDYVEGIDLFLFPYDWRYGVSGVINGTSKTTVDLLQEKIQEIRSQTGSDKVDVVAHSTGGLLVKKYVVDHQLDNNLNKAIFVGVPNTGAPKAVKALVQGDHFGVPLLADGEMKKIAKNLPVVYDLAPSQQYFNQKGSYVKVINQSLLGVETNQNLDYNQSKDFLGVDHSLNTQAITNSNNLHTAGFDNFDLRAAGVDLYSINGCKSGTFGRLVERRSGTLLSGTVVTYDQPDEVPGDGTVPLESSTNLPINQSNKYYALKADHGKMLSQEGIRQEVVNLITGSILNVDGGLISQDISKCKLNGKAVSIFSPLDIDIVDQDGNHSGLVSGGIENNIPNADFEIMGEHKFVYLPTDEGQTYSVSLKGTGSGTFTLKSTEIVNNQPTLTETYKDIPVTTSLKGSLDLANSTKLSLDNNGDNIIDTQLVGKPGEIVTLPKYIFPGFLQPINDTAHQVGTSASVFKAGSTVPVKFQLKKLDGTYTQASSLPVWLTPQKGIAMNLPVDESVYTDATTVGSAFKLEGQQYTYNWSTKGLAAGYWYKISVKLDDGYIYSVSIGLK